MTTIIPRGAQTIIINGMELERTGRGPKPPTEPGVKHDANERTLKGMLPISSAGGQPVVEIPGVGSAPVPAPGRPDAYPVSEDRILVLRNKEGAVHVDTIKLGLEVDGPRIGGHVVPDAQGRFELGGTQIDVSSLKPGERKRVEVELEGQPYSFELRKELEGPISVFGKPKQEGGLLKDLVKGISMVGTLAGAAGIISGNPVLAAVGKGAAALTATDGAVRSLNSGNLLGLAGSALSLAGMAPGQLGQVARLGDRALSLGATAAHVATNGLGDSFLSAAGNVLSMTSDLTALGAGFTGNGSLAQVSSVAGKAAAYTHGAEAALNGNVAPLLTTASHDLARLFAPRPEGQDTLLGGQGNDMLLAQAQQLTPQQEHLRNHGAGQRTAEDLARAIRVADNLAAGGTLNVAPRDGAVTPQELDHAIGVVKQAVQSGDYLPLRASDLNSLGKDPKTFYTQVLSDLNWMRANASALSVQNPVNTLNMGPVRLDPTNSEGRRRLVDIEDVRVLGDNGLLQGSSGGATFDKLWSQLQQAQQQAVESARDLQSAVEQSGGNQQVSQVTYNGREYANPQDRIGPDGNPYTVYRQVNVPAGQRPHELWWSPTTTTLTGDDQYAEIQK